MAVTDKKKLPCWKTENPNAKFLYFIQGLCSVSDEFESVISHTILHKHMPFSFDSDFIYLHFGSQRDRDVSYAEFTQLLHVCNEFNVGNMPCSGGCYISILEI